MAMGQEIEGLLRAYFRDADPSDLADTFERLDDDSIAGLILDDATGPLVRAVWRMRDEVEFAERQRAGFPGEYDVAA